MPKIKKTIPIVDAKTLDKTKPLIDRTCGGCTACCEGWLSGEAHGHQFFHGMPCYYKGNSGCSIYKDRPENPCVSYKCAWLMHPEIFPEWMKPSESKVLINISEHSGHYFLNLLEMGEKMDSKVLSYTIMQYLQGKIPNIRWQVDGAWYTLGSNEFVQAVNGSSPP